MFNEDFFSIHIPKEKNETDVINESKKKARSRVRRINKKWDEELAAVQEWSERWKKVAMQGALETISSHRQAELNNNDILVNGSIYISYYLASGKIGNVEKKGKQYSERYSGRLIVCGRYEEMFLIELFEAGELLSKILLMEGEIAETISPELLLGTVNAEDLLDEFIDDNEAYWQKEDFAKMDFFLRETYHFYADVSLNRELKYLPLIEEMEGLKIYDGTAI